MPVAIYEQESSQFGIAAKLEDLHGSSIVILVQSFTEL